MRIKTYLTLVCLYCCVWTGLNAQQTQYVGPDNGDWFTEANWNNGLPANGNDALIGGGINVVIGSPLTIDFTITNFGGITANAAITNDGTLANSGTFDVSATASFSNLGTFNNFSTTTFAGTADFTNETTGAFTNSGTFTLGATLINRGAVTNNGTIEAPAGTLLTEGTFDNAQTLTTESLTVASGSTFTNNFGSNLFVAGPSALLQIDGNFNNFGNVEVSGTFNISGNFANNVTVISNVTLTISDTGLLNNTGGTVTNNGTLQNEGQIINGFQFVNTGTVANSNNFTNNNLIDNQSGAVFNSAGSGVIVMGFGSKIQNAGSFTTDGVFDSFGTVENAGEFSNGGTINNFSGSLLDNNSLFTNSGVLNTNNQVFNDDEFINDGTINVNGGSVWTNNLNFTNNSSGEINVVQDFVNASTGNLTNNGRFINVVRTKNEGTFTNNAYLENIGIYTNESSGTLLNNELFQQLSGILQNKGSVSNLDFLLSDECSTISNDGTIDNSGDLEVRAIVFQRGTLSGAPVDCQGCYIHTNATSDAPEVCQNVSFGADINGDVKVYAPELIAFANFDSCANIIYLANGVERPVFECSDIGTTIPANILVQIPNTTDSLTCTAIITPVDILEPQFDVCPKDVVVFTDQTDVAVEWTEPVFTDNCSTVNVDASHMPGDIFPVGITGVTYTATDVYGNEGNCQFRVDVRQTASGAGCDGDNTGPVFGNCPTDISLITTGTNANATWVAPTASDDCFPLFINTDFIPGQLFGIGTTTVVYTATDGNNNESTCEFDVTVTFDDPCATDNTPPSFINCPTNIYQPTNGATGGAVAFWTAPNVFDLCGVASISSSEVPGSVFPEGTTTVNYVAEDVNGNAGNCSFTVTVGADPCPDISNGPQVNNCPADFTVQANGNSAVVNWTEPTFTGPCLPLTINSNFLPGATFQIGLTNVVYQASDPKGNASTCSFTVVVEGDCSADSEPPVISNCPSDISVAAVNGNGVATWTAPTAADNCGLISFSSTFSPGASFSSGVTTVVYTAADLFGNIAVCEFNVNVVDRPDCTDNASPINASTNIDPLSLDLSWNASLDASSYDVYLGLNNPPTTVVAADVNGTTVTVSNLQGGTTYFWYVVPKNVAGEAVNCGSNATFFTTAGSTGGGGCNLEALFVASSTNLNSSDAAAKARLETLGFNVTVVDDNQTSTSDADGKGLIFISSTTLSTNVNTKFRDVEVPVICYESYLFDDFRMTGSSSGSSYGTQSYVSQMAIENNTHPLAAGLSGTVNILTSGGTVSWGAPANSAIKIGSIPGYSSRKLIFAYESGDPMVGMNAPARRVGFFLHNSTADELTTNGALLFDEAVKWAAGILPAGTACDDGDANTANDVILSDGCTCQGIACSGRVTGLSFFDLTNGSTSPLVDGGTYLLSELPSSYNILAATSGTLESVNFTVSGAITDSHTENVVPYHYAGDTNPLSLGAGNYTIVVTVFNENQASGLQCDQQVFNFTLIDVPECDPVGQNIQVDGGAYVPGSSVSVCEGQDVRLDFDGNGYELWYFEYTGPNGFFQTNTGSSFSDQLLLANITVSQGGVYNVKYTNPQGCTQITSFTVNVASGAPLAVCQNATLQLVAIGQPEQIDAQDVDGGSSAGCNGTINSLSVSPNSFDQPGVFVVTLKVTNSLGLEADCQATVTVNAPLFEDCDNGIDDDGDGLIDCADPDCGGSGTYTVSSRVNKNSDDAEEKASGDVGTSSSDLELVYDGSNQLVGMRFENMNIPRGATITGAYIEFEADETNSSTTNLTFKGQAADDPATFSGSDYNISNRPVTNAQVNWNNVPSWNSVSEKHQTPDLSVIVQEIIDRNGWISGNSLVVIVSGTGERSAESHNGESHNAPLLVVNYTECSTCDNVSDGGQITKNCAGDQITFNNGQLPSGGSGDVEYLWISGTLDCDPGNMSPVAGAGNNSELTIGAVNETTYFIRCSRRAGCTSWDGESNCIIVEPADCQSSSNLLQTGKIVIEQSNANTWYYVGFDESFDQTPIVILGPPSANSTEQVIPRVRNARPTGFEFQLDEWNYLNGYHPTETLYYLAMLPGNHTIEGVEIEAGSIIADESFTTYNFDQSFGATPLVLTTVASDNDMNAVTPRTRNVSANSFQFKVQEENNSSHADETIHYIAMSEGSFQYGGADFRSDISPNSVTHNWYTIDFGATYDDPGFLASFHTYDGGDVCALRHRNLNSRNVQIRVEEEQSQDSETNHTTEAIGWLVFSASTTLNLQGAVTEQLQLEGVKEDEHAILYWSHNEGHKVSEYVLEKSIDGQTFEVIATMNSVGTARAEVYENYDLSPATGDNFYRIKLLHNDGTVSYSSTISIYYTDLVDFVLFPNPANDFVKINLEEVLGSEEIELSIFNNLGILVQQVEIEKVYGKFFQIDIRQLNEGHYTVWLKIPGRRPIAKQLIVGKL
ncbi:MAG: HYR domain-containing protein [Bacteroidota bacterium]